MDRKNFKTKLTFLSLLMVAGLVLTACSSNTPTPAQNQTATPATTQTSPMASTGNPSGTEVTFNAE
jgi:outer membrane biogenesis lipoprotein LolB